MAKMAGQPKGVKEPTLGRRAREIVAVLLFAAGAFTWLSLHTESVGVVGMWVSRYGRWLLGLTADLPVLLLFLGGYVCLKGGPQSPKGTRFSVGTILLLLVLLVLVHLQTTDVVAVPYMQSASPWSTHQQGAGIIGQFLTAVCLRAFGLAGTYVFATAFLVIAVILLFELPLARSLRGAGRWLRRIAAGLGELVSRTAAIVRSWQKNTIQSGRSTAKPKRRSRKASGEPRAGSAQSEGSGREPYVPSTAKEVAATQEETRAIQESKTKSSVPEDEDEAVPAVRPRKVGPFTLPGPDLLPPVRTRRARRQSKTVDQAHLLEDTLASFGIDARVVDVCQGPTVTRYEIQPPPGVKVSRIVALADDLALALAAPDVRIEAPVPGKSVVGVEVPNKEPTTVYIQDVLTSPEFMNHPSRLAMALGKDIAGKTVIADLRKLPHLLVAGATGSGKSICLNTMIASILHRASPEEVQLLLIDPKRVELSAYNGIPHLVSPVVTDAKKAATALRWAVREMERRYELFADASSRNIDAYNEWMLDNLQRYGEGEVLPYIVIIIDELADLMLVAAADVEDAICRLAQMARAAGMYLIIATQRPSVDVITGLIKANIPSRIAFAVSSQVDSRTILDMAGAERLLGKGDMLYFPAGAPKAIRAQGAFIHERDIAALVDFWSRQVDPEAKAENIIKEQESVDSEVVVDDELFDDAVQLILDSGQASISMLQRRFRIGYSRAARLIDTMELKGIVGPHQGSKPREVLIDQYDSSR